MDLFAFEASLIYIVRHCLLKRKGKERKGKERKGKERKGKERKGKERKGKERKGKEAQDQAWWLASLLPARVKQGQTDL
jgi:hypothetical protein